MKIVSNFSWCFSNYQEDSVQVQVTNLPQSDFTGNFLSKSRNKRSHFSEFFCNFQMIQWSSLFFPEDFQKIILTRATQRGLIIKAAQPERKGSIRQTKHCLETLASKYFWILAEVEDGSGQLESQVYLKNLKPNLLSQVKSSSAILCAAPSSRCLTPVSSKDSGTYNTQLWCPKQISYPKQSFNSVFP